MTVTLLSMPELCKQPDIQSVQHRGNPFSDCCWARQSAWQPADMTSAAASICMCNLRTCSTMSDACLSESLCWPFNGQKSPCSLHQHHQQRFGHCWRPTEAHRRDTAVSAMDAVTQESVLRDITAVSVMLSRSGDSGYYRPQGLPFPESPPSPSLLPVPPCPTFSTFSD